MVEKFQERTNLANWPWARQSSSRGRPIVTDLTPAVGPAGSCITLTGANLDEASVTLAGRRSRVVSAAHNSLVVRVPDGLRAGPFGSGRRQSMGSREGSCSVHLDGLPLTLNTSSVPPIRPESNPGTRSREIRHSPSGIWR
jgi:IPT/TIG domain